MINFIVDIEGVYRKTTWAFGPKKFVFYKMDEIDSTMAHDVRPGKPSLLELLIFSPITKDSLSVYAIPVIQELTRKKFVFLLGSFAFWLIIHTLLMITCYQVPIQFLKHLYNCSNQTAIETFNRSTIDILKQSSILFAMTVFLLTLLIYTSLFIIKDTAEGLLFLTKYLTRRYHKNAVYNAPLQVMFKTDLFRLALACFCTFQAIATYNLFVNHTIVDVYTSIATVLGWSFLVFFTQGFQRTGYFNAVMQNVLFTDLVSFSIVIVMLLCGVGIALILITYDPRKASDVEGIMGLKETWLTLFQVMTGLYSFDQNTLHNNDILAFLFVIFVCMALIVLMNLLIAAMSESYASLSPYKTELGIRSKASAILTIERQVGSIFMSFVTKKKCVKSIINGVFFFQHRTLLLSLKS